MTAGPPDIAWPAIAAVAILTALALAAHWWLKRRGLIAPSTHPIKVIATRSLGTKRAVAIVEVESQRFLLGLTDEAISFLGNLSSEGRATATPPALSFPGKVANAQ